jgi:hypothetical protein
LVHWHSMNEACLIFVGKYILVLLSPIFVGLDDRSAILGVSLKLIF